MVSENVRLDVMTEGDLDAVSRFHQEVGHSDRIVPASLRFEYFDNPDPGSALYYSSDVGGRVVATEGYIAQPLIRRDERHLSMLIERSLIDPSLRGTGAFSKLHEFAMHRACGSGPGEFVWGTTAAVKAYQSYGFDTYDCFFDLILVLSLDPIRALLSQEAATLKQKVFFGLVYAASRGKRLLSRRRRRGGGGDVRVEAGLPEADAVTAFLRAFYEAHPGSFFVEHSAKKLDWLVRRNEFRERELASFHTGGAVTGLAILERERGGIASICDFLVLESGAIEHHCAALINYLKGRGFGAARLFGNGENPYLARLGDCFSGLGAVRLAPKSHLAIRGPASSREAHPPVSDLAITGLWGPPV